MADLSEEEKKLVIDFHMKLDPIREGSQDAVSDVYDQLAATYDEMARIIEMPYAKVTTELINHTTADLSTMRVLDVGAGTGLLGKEMHSKGILHIDALDISPVMLEMCKERQVYENMLKVPMSPDPTPGIEPDTYDAIVSLGSFVEGHVHIDSLFELCRISKPNGLIVILLHDMHDRMGYMSTLGKLIKEKKAVLISMVRTAYKREFRINFDYVYGYMIVLKVL